MISRRTHIGPALLAAAALAAAACYVVPRGLKASALLAIEDDSARIAARMALRVIRYRKERRLRRFAALTARG